MPLHLVPVHVPTEIPLLASIHLDAFLTSPLNRAIYASGPTPAVLDSIATHHMVALLQDPTVRFFKIIESSNPNPDSTPTTSNKGEKGEVIAFMKLHIFDTHSSLTHRTDNAVHRPWPDGVNLPLVNFFWTQLSHSRTGMSESLGPHVLVHILATAPSHQRKGAGGLLMRYATDIADEMGLPSYLEASPAGKTLYEACGFGEVGGFWTDLGRFAGGEDKGENWRKEARAKGTGLEVEEGKGKGWYWEGFMVRPARVSEGVKKEEEK